MFDHGRGVELFFETRVGMVRFEALVTIRGKDLILKHASLYPATSSHLAIGVGELLKIFRWCFEQAIQEGYRSCSLEGFRVSGARPGRMIYLTRSQR